MNKILEVKDLYKVYKGKKKEADVVAVNGLSFDGYGGEILGVLGPNGSGKTSTMKAITSILDIDGGQVLVNNHDVSRQRKKVLGHIGAVLEGARNIYWNLSPIENMFYFASLKGLGKKDISHRIEKYLALLGLEEVAHKPVRKFSKGMQQKVAIACSLIHDPKLVLLDEPTLGLDVETKRTMQNFIKEISHNDRLILITSHDMQFIEKTCNRVVIIKKGSCVVQDTVANLSSFFHKTVYKISVLGSLEAQFLEMLGKVGELRTEKGDNTTELYFVLSDTHKLYEIFEVLNSCNAELLNLDVLRDNLEDIFMSIINDRENAV